MFKVQGYTSKGDHWQESNCLPSQRDLLLHKRIWFLLKVLSFRSSSLWDRTLQIPGPSCSKLTMSLVNVLFKLWSLNTAYTLIFCWKNVNTFCIGKTYSHFFSKNTCEFDIVLTKTSNILTTTELIKLTMLWTTGPWESNACKKFSAAQLKSLPPIVKWIQNLSTDITYQKPKRPYLPNYSDRQAWANSVDTVWYLIWSTLFAFQLLVFSQIKWAQFN